MASGPLISWQMDGEKSMNSGRFYFLGLQNYLEVDCCHEIKMHAPWEESYNKPRQHVKSRDITLLTSKLCFFPAVMYRCENWTIKKAEH